MGMTISINLLVLKASKLDRDFCGKSASAKYSCIKRWMAKKNLNLWAVTHEYQKIPDETIAEAKAFVSIQVPYLIGPHRDKKWIANMDLTPVYFSMTPRTTVESRGARTVNGRSSSSSTMRVTMACTICADGSVLAPYSIFKGKKGGRIIRVQDLP